MASPYFPSSQAADRPPAFPVKFNGGNNTTSPKETIQNGELVQSTGGWYTPGNFAAGIARIEGRALYGTVVSGQPIKGLAFCIFDTNVPDELVAYVGSGYYRRDAYVPGNFSLLYGNLSAYGEKMFAGKADDSWYLVNGVNRNMVYEGSGVIRVHGMDPPNNIDPALFFKSAAAPSVSGVAMGYVHPSGYAISHASGASAIAPCTTWTNPNYAFDSGVSNAYYTEAQVISSGITRFDLYGFTLVSGSNLILNIDYSVDKQETTTDTGSATQHHHHRPGPVTTVPQYSFKVSKDNGTNYSGIFTDINWSIRNRMPFQFNLSGYANTTSGLRFRIETYQPGVLGGTYSMRVWDVAVLGGGTSGVSLNQQYFGDPSVPAFTTISGGVYYGVTEFDSTRRLESNAWVMPSPFVFYAVSGDNSAVLILPSGSRNPNATHFRVYKTTDGGLAPQDLGLLGEVPISNTQTVFVDQFNNYGQFDILPIKYPMLRVVESDGTALYYDLNTAPRSWSNIENFQGSLVGIDAENPRMLWYTPPGYPDSSPEVYAIRSFPMDEHDLLISTVSLDEVLIIFTESSVLVSNGLPLIGGDGVFNLGSAKKMEGVPGLTSPDGTAVFTSEGVPACAWISPFGIYLTNGQTAKRITDEMDWESTVNQAALSTAVLSYDHSKRVLRMDYDSNGDGKNDRYVFFHVYQNKPMVQWGVQTYPRWTGPHYGACNAIASAVTSGVSRIYSGHSADGNVYAEWSGTRDASNSFDSNATIPFIVRTGRQYLENYSDLSVYKVSLRHSDFGPTASGLLTVYFNRDQHSHEDQVLSKWVSLSGYRGTEVLIGRSFEHAEWQFEYYGSGIGTITDLRTLVRQEGQSGGK